jgi:hypothetical protein
MSAVITQTSALAQLANGAEAAGELVLQPGAVVDASVLAVRENLARIVIAGLAIEVLTEVALQPGAALKLAVSQTAEGNVRLAVVPPDTAVRGQAALPAGSGVAAPASPVSPAVITPAGAPQVVSSPSLAPASPEAVAISQAVQTAAPKQASLAPLFANLPVIVASDRVPRQVQSAASQLLATRPPLDGKLTADELRQAFQKSGLFLESSLARGAAPQGSPDLKAALVVFKQVLTNWLGQTAPTAQFPVTAAQPAGQGTPLQAQAPSQPPLPATQQALPAAAPAATAASTIVLRAQVPQSGLTSAPADAQPQDPSAPAIVARDRPSIPAEVVRATVQLATREAVDLLRTGAERAANEAPARAAQPLPGQQGQTARATSDAPPPFRGAAPSPQPIAAPTLAPDAPPANIGRQLLEQTDAALARQTLLQVASLPDRPDLGGASQSNQPRWSFEIPFATPQGTAVAQFEISRDGGNEVEAASPSRVWRARFTLDVEPAGPVHALVSLVGDKTAVRMWAERPETAAQLRAGAGALGDALRRAELEPGDILIGDGAPPQPKMRAGRFLDRAT